MARYFHLVPLTRTLFSPWKRDVTYRSWRGLHPLRSLEALTKNLLSRLVGAVVRTVVLLGGGLMLGLAVLCAVVGLFLFLSGPLLLALGAILCLQDPISGAPWLLCGMIGVGMALIGFVLRSEPEPLSYDVAEIAKKRWFRRVLERLGIERSGLEAEVLRDDTRFRALLAARGIDPKTYARAVDVEHRRSEKLRADIRFWRAENLARIRAVGLGWRYGYTPHLDQYVLDLSEHDTTIYAQAELIGRQDALRLSTIVLERPVENSVLLVGDPGIGKGTFIHHLARLIRENAFRGGFLSEARVLICDLGAVLNDAERKNEDAEALVRRMFYEAAFAGNVVLVVENLDQYLGDTAARRNLAPLFAEFLALPSFRLIATATSGHYQMLTKTAAEVLKFLEAIELPETTEDETLAVLVDHFAPLEAKRVLFTVSGLESIIRAAGRSHWETPLPERALDLAQEVETYSRSVAEEYITSKTVEAFLTLKTGVQTGEVGAEEKDKLLHLEEMLHRRIVGQDSAVRQVAEAMRKARTGLGNDKRPLGSFIFFGPSGVGKTETVKAFAESYFGSEDKMIRLDMSEYQTDGAVNRLIGSRELGLDGELTRAAKEHPMSILLLDEIEKAYPKALDLFLQILDEGYVTDGYGEKVNFRNMVIVATSNAGAALIKDLVREKASMEEIRTKVTDHIIEANLFRLEFLSRFDGMVFFEPLTAEELLRVTTIKLDTLAERIKKEKNITITFAPEVPPLVVERGFEPQFGSRSINRYIENSIEDTLVKRILEEKMVPGGTYVFAAADLA